MTLFKRLADTLSGSGKRERYVLKQLSNVARLLGIGKKLLRNFRKWYCQDCIRSIKVVIKQAGMEPISFRGERDFPAFINSHKYKFKNLTRV